MPHKSKLTDKQWNDIIKRKLAGEKTRPLAREYGVSEGAIRHRVGTQCTQIKETAIQILAVEEKFNSLSLDTQVKTIDYASGLRAMSGNMLNAGISSSSTSAKLAELAEAMAAKLQYRETMTVEEIEVQLVLLKSIIALQNTANSANIIPMGLLGLNKPAAEKLIPTPSDVPRDIPTIIEKLNEYDRKRGLVN